jgi:hypothetical protein
MFTWDLLTGPSRRAVKLDVALYTDNTVSKCTGIDHPLDDIIIQRISISEVPLQVRSSDCAMVYMTSSLFPIPPPYRPEKNAFPPPSFESAIRRRSAMEEKESLPRVSPPYCPRALHTCSHVDEVGHASLSAEPRLRRSSMEAEDEAFLRANLSKSTITTVFARDLYLVSNKPQPRNHDRLSFVSFRVAQLPIMGVLHLAYGRHQEWISTATGTLKALLETTGLIPWEPETPTPPALSSREESDVPVISEQRLSNGSSTSAKQQDVTKESGPSPQGLSQGNSFLREQPTIPDDNVLPLREMTPCISIDGDDPESISSLTPTAESRLVLGDAHPDSGEGDRPVFPNRVHVGSQQSLESLSSLSPRDELRFMFGSRPQSSAVDTADVAFLRSKFQQLPCLSGDTSKGAQMVWFHEG